ncbi:MAG TPA: electron transfer flavoprotein subunit beta/FixA family protein, partial [bacterium]|nr:electron transfer flavoprotein subunit beta/FixA family protein [bacterium]
AMGILKAIHIDTTGKTYDAYQTASALASVIKEGGYDLVLCGKQAIDHDNASVPQMLAELMGAPQVTVVDKMEVAGNKVKVQRRVSGGAREVYDVTTPAVFSCERGLNTPRYASLPGIMKAKSKPIDKKQADAVLAGATPLVQFANYELPPERAAGKKLTGEPAEQVEQLAKLLREEAKVI